VGSRLRAVFPRDWRYVLDVYKDFLASTGARAVNSEDTLLALLEVGVRFGERISRLHVNGFVEIGCGMAIPSLALARLGHTKGRAIDVDPEVLARAEDLKRRLGCELKIECRDVFEDRPELWNGDLLIAEKPASYKKNVLEVEYNIANWCKIEGHDLAMIPSYLPEDTPARHSERCGTYERKLRQVGFKVENRRVCEPLPFRWIIAIKHYREGVS